MRYAISGIALINGLKLRRGHITCTAKRTSNGEISVNIKKHSKLMRKIQGIALFVLVLFSMLPDASNTPESALYTVIIPITIFLAMLRYSPNLRILNYHGAEHKVVVAYINKLPLTLETVKPVSRVTKVCGTMLIVPIIFYLVLLSTAVMYIQNTLIHILLTGAVFLLLIHYFLLRGEEVAVVYLNRLLPFLKKKPYRIRTNELYKIFDRLGYFLQEHFTTREPSDDELEVAIVCMRRLLEEE